MALDNLPKDTVPKGLVHGDFGLANLLVENDEVSAVVDWELSYLGDACGDFIFLMPKYDRELLDIYEQAGGVHISEYRHTYFQILKIVKSANLMVGAHSLMANESVGIKYYVLASYIHHLTAPINALIEKASKLENRD